MWLYIIQGIGYGFAAAVQPGPLQTYLIAQTLSKGWKMTLPAALAPLISDGPIIAFCLLILSQVPLWLQRFLYIAGGLFVLAGWRETPINGVGFLAGFYVTMILSLGTLIIVFGSTRQLGPRVKRALLGISAVALFCFGLIQLWKGMMRT